MDQANAALNARTTAATIDGNHHCFTFGGAAVANMQHQSPFILDLGNFLCQNCLQLSTIASREELRDRRTWTGASPNACPFRN
jgi:hypothetical protein